jgi:hypothetical protein
VNVPKYMICLVRMAEFFYCIFQNAFFGISYLKLVTLFKVGNHRNLELNTYLQYIHRIYHQKPLKSSSSPMMAMLGGI